MSEILLINSSLFSFSDWDKSLAASTGLFFDRFKAYSTSLSSMPSVLSHALTWSLFGVLTFISEHLLKIVGVYSCDL